MSADWDISTLNNPGNSDLDMLRAAEDFTEKVRSGEIRYFQIQAIRNDDCTATLYSGESTYVERLGLTHMMLQRHEQEAVEEWGPGDCEEKQEGEEA